MDQKEKQANKTNLIIQEVKRDSNLEGQTPECMEAGTEVDNAVCVSTHKIDNFSCAERGLSYTAHGHSLSVHCGYDGTPYL